MSGTGKPLAATWGTQKLVGSCLETESIGPLMPQVRYIPNGFEAPGSSLDLTKDKPQGNTYLSVQIDCVSHVQYIYNYIIICIYIYSIYMWDMHGMYV